MTRTRKKRKKRGAQVTNYLLQSPEEMKLLRKIIVILKSMKKTYFSTISKILLILAETSKKKCLTHSWHRKYHLQYLKLAKTLGRFEQGVKTQRAGL